MGSEIVRRDLIPCASIKIEYFYGHAAWRNDAIGETLKTDLIDLLVCRIDPELSVFMQRQLKERLEVFLVGSHVCRGHHLAASA